MLSAYVPRNLRIRASIQLASTRVPARAFLLVAGLIFVGGLLIVAGAELMGTVKLIGALILVSLAMFEIQCWGRSTREVARIIWRHYRRPRQLQLEALLVIVPNEISRASYPRRPRWQTDR
jgi:hypothetical protein